MAYRLFPLFNIDQPVGPRKPNKQDDVLLVQNLFIEVARFDAIDWFALVPAQSRTLATTGVFDDTLETWILSLQRWAAKSFGTDRFKVDGIIDPMPVESIAATLHFKSGRISILGYLCNRLWRWNRDAYLRIGDDYRIPWVPKEWTS